MGRLPPSYDFFWHPPPPDQNRCPSHGVPPHLKMKCHPPPHYLKKLLPLKHETPFHEMIPRKSTINTLKSSQNPWKICVKKYIFSKFGGFQGYSRHLYCKKNFVAGIFGHLKFPHAFDLSSPPSKFKEPPPMFTTPVGNPALHGVSSLNVLVCKIHIYMPQMWFL